MTPSSYRRPIPFLVSSVFTLFIVACTQQNSNPRSNGNRDAATPTASGGKGGSTTSGSGGSQAGGAAGATTAATGGVGGVGGSSSVGSGGLSTGGSSGGSGGQAGTGGATLATGGQASGGSAGGLAAAGGRNEGGAGGVGGVGGSTTGTGGVAGASGGQGGGGTGGDGFVSLFNGKDLTGWTVKATTADAGRVGMIKVDNGSILFDVDSGGQYMWLYNEGEYKDFHFKCKFQVYKDSKHNSGIQFRSRYEPTLDYSGSKGYLNGPQCDLDATDPPRAQSIYDETISVRDWILGGYNLPAPAGWKFYWSDDPIAWNDHEIIATGTRVRIIVNGVQIVDHDFKGILDNADHSKYNVGMSGHFALQRHTGEVLKMRFKDIYVKDLTGVTNYMP